MREERTDSDLYAVTAIVWFIIAPVVGIALAIAIGFFFGAGWGFVAIALEAALAALTLVRGYRRLKKKEDP